MNRSRTFYSKRDSVFASLFSLPRSSSREKGKRKEREKKKREEKEKKINACSTLSPMVVVESIKRFIAADGFVINALHRVVNSRSSNHYWLKRNCKLLFTSALKIIPVALAMIKTSYRRIGRGTGERREKGRGGTGRELIGRYTLGSNE